MRSHIRTILVLALALGLLGLFLYNVDVRGVIGEIMRSRPEWLLVSMLTMLLNLAIRAWRWQYLLEPLGSASFGNAFRATAVGFAASSVLPARAGEVIRPYFLARHERMSATGAFATIVLERLLDMIAVLVLLASYVFIFGRDLEAANALAFTAVKWAGATAAAAFRHSAACAGIARRPARARGAVAASAGHRAVAGLTQSAGARTTAGDKPATCRAYVLSVQRRNSD